MSKDERRFVPVVGHSGLYRDQSSGGIINTNDTLREAYRRRSEKINKRNQRLDKQEEDIQNLKEDVGEIKDMLRQLLDKKGS